MPKAHRRHLIAALLAAGLLAACASGPPQPKLLVVIVVDQFRADYLTRFDTLFTGGFRTLLDEGAVFENAAWRHALTLTAAGHASIMTGVHPAQSGMIANNWYDPAANDGAGGMVNCVDDADYLPVGGPGRSASTRGLLAETLGDRLKQQYAGAKVVSLSFKDRAAMLMGGHAADGTYWFSPGCGCFITSSYFRPDLPAWLQTFNDPPPADQFRGKDWTRLLGEPAKYEEFARPDAYADEGNGTQITFPHRLGPDPGDYRDNLRRTGYADGLLTDLVLAAIDGESLGADGEPDLLAVSFSATDYVGHTYGPFSQEAMDQVLRLDRQLARLLTALDEKVGRDGYVLALSADHGAAPVVTYAKAVLGKDAEAIPRDLLGDTVTAAVSKAFPQLENVIGGQDIPHITFDVHAFQRAGVDLTGAATIAKTALLKLPQVDGVYTHADMDDESEIDDNYWQLYRNSFFPRRSPHLMVRLKPYKYVDKSQGATGHGTPHGYDRNVPVLFFGGPITAGKHTDPAGPEDIAATLGHFANVKMPTEPDARQLTELLPE